MKKSEHEMCYRGQKRRRTGEATVQSIDFSMPRGRWLFNNGYYSYVPSELLKDSTENRIIE